MVKAGVKVRNDFYYQDFEFIEKRLPNNLQIIIALGVHIQRLGLKKEDQEGLPINGILGS